MRKDATAQEIQGVVQAIEARGYKAHPIPGAHSIGELIAHIDVTQKLILARLRGESPNATDADFFPPVSDTSDKALKDAVARLKAQEEELIGAAGRMTDEQLTAAIPGGATAYETLHGHAQHNAFQASLAHGLDIAQHGVEIARAEDEIAGLTRYGARLVASGEPDYPPLLAYIPAAPPLVTMAGGQNLDWLRTVAIVGARNASAAGIKMTRLLAGDLGERGYTVVSGLARGIDAAAHCATLTSGTIAVLAGGFDKIYPDENIPLAHDILDNGGALLTEMPLGPQVHADVCPAEAIDRLLRVTDDKEATVRRREI